MEASRIEIYLEARAKVKAHMRRSKTGKVSQVRQHEREVTSDPKKWIDRISGGKPYDEETHEGTMFEALFFYADGVGVPNEGLRGLDDISKESMRDIKHIDKAIESFKLDKPTVAYRGMMLDAKSKLAASIKPGAVFHDKGFVSTSLSKRISAEEFAFDTSQGEAGYLFNIKIPKGTRAAPIYAIPGNSYKYQKELLLKRGSKFKIIGVKKLNNGNHYQVEAEYVK